MRALLFRMLVPMLAGGLTATWAQQSSPAPATSVAPAAEERQADAAYVIEFNGKRRTAAELEMLLQAVPEPMRKDRQAALQQLASMELLAQRAEEKKLHEQAPYKEQLAWQRNNLLATAMVNQVRTFMGKSGEALRQHYEANKDKYTQAKLRGIWLPYSSAAASLSDPSVKKPMTEAEAKTKAETIIRQVRDGAEFATLAEQHSEHPESRAKGGALNPIRKGDNLPDTLKSAIFAAKPGQVLEPMRMPNGYYIFLVEGISVQPFEAVEAELGEELKQAEFSKYLDDVKQQTGFKVLDPKYVQEGPAKPAAGEVGGK